MKLTRQQSIMQIEWNSKKPDNCFAFEFSTGLGDPTSAKPEAPPTRQAAVTKSFTVADDAQPRWFKIRVLDKMDKELAVDTMVLDPLRTKGAPGKDGTNGKDGVNGEDGQAATLLNLSDGLTVPKGDITASTMIVNSPQNKPVIVLDGSDASLALGGNGDDGDIILFDAARKITVGINGQRGAVLLGGNGHDGDLVVYNSQGRDTIHLDGESGGLRGELQQSSSASIKSNIEPLPPQDALQWLGELRPVTFAYRADPTKRKQAGFIAEETPDIASGEEKKAIAPANILAILTSVIQTQQDTITRLDRRIADLEAKKPS